MGTFITDGANVLPPVKSDLRTATGATTEWAASDANELRQAALDLRDGLITEASARIAADEAIIASGQAPANVELAPVTPTGSSTTLAVRDWLARVDVGADVIPARNFGLLPNLGTDQTQAFIAMRQFLIQHDGRTIVFEAGEYHHSDPSWLKGVKNVRIIGSGTKIKNVTIGQPTGYADYDRAALMAGQNYLDSSYAPAPEATTRPPMYLVSVGSGRTRTITLATAAEASNFSNGDDVLLFGYCQQDGGWPWNPRYYEILTVYSVNAGTGVITFTRNLKYDYDSRWPNFTNSNGTYGAPRIVNLSRVGYTLGGSLYMEGIEFLRASNEYHASDYLYDGGYVNFTGFRHVELHRIKGGNLGIGAVERVVAVDCDFGETEPDKMCDSIRYVRCRFGKVSSGASTIVTFDDCDIYDVAGPMSCAGVVTFNRCNLYSSYAGTWKAQAVYGIYRFRECNFFRVAADPNGEPEISVEYAPQPHTVTAVTAPSSTSIEVAFAVAGQVEPAATIIAGTFLYRADGSNEGVVSRPLYLNSGTGRLVVEATFRNPPSPGDVFCYGLVRDLSMQDCMEMSGSTWNAALDTPLVQVFKRDGANSSYRNNMEGSLAKKIMIPLPIGAGFVCPIGGVVTGIEVHVMTAGSAGCKFVVYSPSGGTSDDNMILTFDAAVTGPRRLDVWSVLGAKAGDKEQYSPAAEAALSTPLKDNRFQTNFTLYYANPQPAVKPTGFITFDILNVPWRGSVI